LSQIQRYFLSKGLRRSLVLYLPYFPPVHIMLLLSLGAPSRHVPNSGDSIPLTAVPGNSDNEDSQLVGHFLAAVGREALSHGATVCAALARTTPAIAADVGFARATSRVIDSLLGRHLDALFDNHLSVVVASAVYFAARMRGHDGVAFKAVVAAALEGLPGQDASVFAAVEIEQIRSAGGRGLAVGKRGAHTEGNAREYYNSCLLPVLERFKSEALELEAAADSESSGDGAPSASVEDWSDSNEDEDEDAEIENREVMPLPRDPVTVAKAAGKGVEKPRPPLLRLQPNGNR
jgi:hypothetical protein